MLTLYTKPGCAFCAKVKEEAAFLNVPYTEKSVLDEGVVEELVQRGGQRQVPFLWEEGDAVSLYGSDDIVAYLHKRFR